MYYTIIIYIVKNIFKKTKTPYNLEQREYYT